MTHLPDAIYFDWDGTLADSFAFLQEAHNQALKALDLPPRDSGWFHFYFGKDREFIYKDIYEDQANAAKFFFEAFVREHHVTHVKPLPYAHEVLQTLKRQKVKSGVVTNKVGDFVRKEIAAFEWNDYFSVIVGAGEAERDKPSSAPLKMAAGENQNIWYVGDSIADMLCADEYGCLFILVHPHLGTVPDFYDADKTHAVFSNLHDFHQYLLQFQ